MKDWYAVLWFNEDQNKQGWGYWETHLVALGYREAVLLMKKCAKQWPERKWMVVKNVH